MIAATRKTLMLPTLTALVAAAIVLGVFAPHDPLPQLAPRQDKWEHLVAFALLSALLLLQRGRFWLRLGAALAFVAVIEAVQGALIPSRSASLSDLAWGGAGVGIGALAALLVRALRIDPAATGVSAANAPK